ncbi:hypothetical protein [Rufibacter sp. XAAS-G3-1]|uniref:hypothetical protein n=1 Tax=Rufibacter sp. XAAS-G3-1 TaxID=2729134 RepID=UPI00351A1D0C
MAFVEEAKNSVDVASLLNTNLKEPFRVLNVLKISIGNSWKILYQVKSPDDFILHLIPLFYKELFKIVLKENDGSVLLFSIHEAKIEKVALKENCFKGSLNGHRYYPNFLYLKLHITD